MQTRLLAAAAVAALVTLGGGGAQALTTIDFEGDAPGAVADGFVSAGFSQIQFFTDLGAGLEVASVPEGDGKSLLAGDDTNGNFIRGAFTDGVHSFLSLTFGNDDPFFSNPGDRAVLTLFLGADLVGSTFVLLNRNDLMDQTIGFMSGPFDSFTFAYTNAAGSPFTGGGSVNVGLIEVIDHITFDAGVGAVVPEPATWGMMILGFGGVGALLRRRRATFA